MSKNSLLLRFPTVRAYRRTGQGMATYRHARQSGQVFAMIDHWGYLVRVHR